MSKVNQSFCANFKAKAEYETGLRGQFEYRDLGISQATQGQYHAGVMRIRDGAKGDQSLGNTGMHRHLCDFQMFYVLKGWCTMEYEGEGTMTFHEGDSCLQPAAIAHDEIVCSEDFECIEIYSPAKHETVAID
tara:strand:+ start:252 stop:650 length:399 start_codon:yes stop_codon:yes gene_type:complete